MCHQVVKWLQLTFICHWTLSSTLIIFCHVCWAWSVAMNLYQQWLLWDLFLDVSNLSYHGRELPPLALMIEWCGHTLKGLRANSKPKFAPKYAQVQGSQLSWNSWNVTDVLKSAVVLKFCSFGRNALIWTLIFKFVATRWHLLRLKCTKFDFGWGSAPDPAWGAYSAPPGAP